MALHADDPNTPTSFFVFFSRHPAKKKKKCVKLLRALAAVGRQLEKETGKSHCCSMLLYRPGTAPGGRQHRYVRWLRMALRGTAVTCNLSIVYDIRGDASPGGIMFRRRCNGPWFVMGELLLLRARGGGGFRPWKEGQVALDSCTIDNNANPDVIGALSRYHQPLTSWYCCWTRLHCIRGGKRSRAQRRTSYWRGRVIAKEGSARRVRTVVCCGTLRSYGVPLPTLGGPLPFLYGAPPTPFCPPKKHRF